MKILIISHMYPSLINEVKGIFVHQQVQELQKQLCNIKVVSPTPWTPFPIKHFTDKWKKYSEIPVRTSQDGIDVWYPRYLVFPRSRFFHADGLFMYYGIQNTIAEIYHDFKFDLIHAHVALPDGYAGVLLAKKYQKPTIVTVHGQDFQHTINMNIKCKQAVQKVIDNANRIIVVSHKLKRLAEQNMNCAKNISVIGNGVNPDELFQGSNALEKDWKNKRVLLSVSSLIQTKGIDLNLKALRQLIEKHKDLFYVIVGEGEIRSTLDKLIVTLGLEKHVKFVGQQSYSRTMEYMAACTIFSLPSWQEGFGVVYLEAMAHGKPVIGCKGEGIEDVITHEKTGLLVKPRDVNSLVAAIDFLLGYPQEAIDMGERAHKMVLANYTWEKNAEKTIEVYKTILNVN